MGTLKVHVPRVPTWTTTQRVLHFEFLRRDWTLLCLQSAGVRSTPRYSTPCDAHGADEGLSHFGQLCQICSVSLSFVLAPMKHVPIGLTRARLKS
jgi:hypothetical protein